MLLNEFCSRFPNEVRRIAFFVDAVEVAMPVQFAVPFGAEVIDRSVVVTIEMCKPMIERMERPVS